MTRIKWKCRDCGDVFVTEPDRHVLKTCEEGCGWVDHETYGYRGTLNMEFVERCVGEENE